MIAVEGGLSQQTRSARDKTMHVIANVKKHKANAYVIYSKESDAQIVRTRGADIGTEEGVSGETDKPEAKTTELINNVKLARLTYK